MTIPSLDPIVDAVRAVRARYLPDVADWAADILAGDSAALVVGQELMRAVNRLHDELEGLAGSLDLSSVERLVGAGAVIDAVLIATGECPSEDPEVHERFRPARLERERCNREVMIERYDGRAEGAEGAELVEQCRADLALIAAGIEPE